MSEPEDDVDPLQSLHAEIMKQQARILLLKNPSAAGITQEMGATVLAIVLDVVVALTQVRDGHDEALIDLDDRLEAIEEEESKLTAEDAEKLHALVDTTKHLVEVIRGAGTQSPEVERALTLATTLADECAEIIEGAEMEGDDDEDPEEPGTPQLGTGE